MWREIFLPLAAITLVAVMAPKFLGYAWAVALFPAYGPVCGFENMFGPRDSSTVPDGEQFYHYSDEYRTFAQYLRCPHVPEHPPAPPSDGFDLPYGHQSDLVENAFKWYFDYAEPRFIYGVIDGAAFIATLMIRGGAAGRVALFVFYAGFGVALTVLFGHWVKVFFKDLGIIKD
jgi:hypothetical protein